MSVNTYSHLVSTAAMKNSKVFARTQEDFRHTVRERRNRTTFITGAQVKHADSMRCCQDIFNCTGKVFREEPERERDGESVHDYHE